MYVIYLDMRACALIAALMMPFVARMSFCRNEVTYNQGDIKEEGEV